MIKGPAQALQLQLYDIYIYIYIYIQTSTRIYHISIHGRGNTSLIFQFCRRWTKVQTIIDFLKYWEVSCFMQLEGASLQGIHSESMNLYLSKGLKQELQIVSRV